MQKGGHIAITLVTRVVPPTHATREPDDTISARPHTNAHHHEEKKTSAERKRKRMDSARGAEGSAAHAAVHAGSEDYGTQSAHSAVAVASGGTHDSPVGAIPKDSNQAKKKRKKKKNKQSPADHALVPSTAAPTARGSTTTPEKGTHKVPAQESSEGHIAHSLPASVGSSSSVMRNARPSKATLAMKRLQGARFRMLNEQVRTVTRSPRTYSTPPSVLSHLVTAMCIEFRSFALAPLTIGDCNCRTLL